MNVNLFKRASTAARELGEQLRNVLSEFDDAAAIPLLDRLAVDAHSSPLLVFTGYHSSGKSTLIEALTDREFSLRIGSGITTDAVTEYNWDGDVRLVDTPGVHVDRAHHDELAEKALQSADLVLFAVPVELFDDILVAHLRDVLGRLGKARQTLIIVTKAGTLVAAPGVRGAAIKEALGPFDEVPWVECDAQYYLQGLDLVDTEPADSKVFIEASGLTDVATLINGFARQQGELGRLSQPLQLIVALTLEATAMLADNPDEQAALTVLARQRSALSRKRIHLDGLLEARAAQFRRDAVQAATQLADSIELDEHREPSAAQTSSFEAHLSTLNRNLGVALDRFQSAVRQALEVQFDDLASEVLEIQSSPYGQMTLALDEPESGPIDIELIKVRPKGTNPVQSPSWSGDLSEHLKRFHKFWGAGDGAKAAAGGNGHQVVLGIGHAFGKKFKPWQAVKLADKIGRVAKVGGAAIGIGLELYGVIADERSAVKAEQAIASRRRSVTQEVLGQADGIVASALQGIGGNLENVFKPELDRIDAMARKIYNARTTRSDLRDRLDSVRQRADAALAELANQA